LIAQHFLGLTQCGNAAPVCSVVIAAYNAGNYIKAAVESMQLQSLQEIEIIVVDDGSDDTTAEIVSNITTYDSRVHLKRLPINQGQSFALNVGICASRGKYVALMDADDIAFPHRLELQVSAMEQDARLILIGGSVVTMCGVTGENGVTWKYEADQERIKISSLFKSEFMSGAMCLRREKLFQYQLFFDPTIKIGADWEFSIRAMKLGQVKNIPEAVIRYRIHKAQVTANLSDNCTSSSAVIRKTQLKYLGVNPSIEEMMVHLAISPCNYWAYGSHPYFMKCENNLPILASKWFARLQNANKKSGQYDIHVFKQYLQELEYLISHVRYNKSQSSSYCPVTASRACFTEISCRQ
jgi:glycosyltransferase involved in cell wall biosynthesis